MTSRLLLNLAVAAGAAWFGAAAYGSLAPDATDLPEEADRAAPSEPRFVRFEAPGMGAFDEVSARPLFAEDRRPPIAAAPAAPGGAAPPPAIELAGVMIAGDSGRALVRGAGGPVAGPVEVLGRGDRIAGWTLAAIEARRIVLERGGQRHEVVMGEAAPPEAAASAGAGPAGPASRLPALLRRYGAADVD